MPRRQLIGTNVYGAALERMLALYQDDNRVIVSFSAGKDSGVTVELAIQAARQVGRLPVEVVMRDEEIMFPGTVEYAARVADRSEVDFRWISARQPVLNVFNRARPYFWVFDPEIDSTQWVRQPPTYMEWVPEQNIEALVTPERYPVGDGQPLICVIGLRATESAARRMAIWSSRGYLTKPTRRGVIKARPIYDWLDADVWKAHQEFGWDYNHAYDTMLRMGITQPKQLRIAPPTMNVHGAPLLQVAAKAWPEWFDRVATRLPGCRAAANFGDAVLKARRNSGETWEETFERECVRDAPAWIAERSQTARDHVLRQHRKHSRSPLPQSKPCSASGCTENKSSWRKLTNVMYDGNPWSVASMHALPIVEPEFFREGSGTWDGKPNW